MSLRSIWSRPLALLLGWALVLSVLGVAPGHATDSSSSGTQAAAPSGVAASVVAAAAVVDRLQTTGGDATGGDAGGSTDEDVVSLLDGLDLEIAGTAGSGGATGTATGTGTDDAGTDQPTIDPAVTDALEEALAADGEGSVSVVIEMTGSADLAEVTADADSAALEAAREVREQASAYDADTAHEAAEAADAARGQVVVDTLRETGAEQRADLIAALGGMDQTDAAGGTEPVDLWIANSVGATLDAEALETVAARDDVAHIRTEEQIELPEITSEPALPTWSLEKVNAPQTWGEHGYRGAGVTVAVLDTGVDFEHPALAGQYRGRDGDHSDSWFVTTGENYPTPGDGNGHGTHVTGSIAGGAPGDIIGVAPDAEWIGVKILNDGGRGGEVGILNGMQWVLAPGGDPAKAPDIANNSWGSGPGDNRTYWEAVEAWRAAGIVPLFANGNDGPGPGTVGNPGGYPHSIGVGATDSNDVIAGFSSRGPVVWDGVEYTKPQVSAPGAAIYSAWPQDSGQDYHTISGTSMATPHVSGVAALVLGAAPGLGVDELQEVLEGTARTEPAMGTLPNDAYGFGIVDAYAATTRAAQSGLVSGQVTGPDGPVAATVQVVDGPATTADADTGSYELYALAGTQTLQVSAYGYHPQTHTVEVEQGGHVELDPVLEPQTQATLTGTVTSDGDPVAAAAVSVVDAPDATAYSDDAGTYTLDLPEGTHALRVVATGYRPWSGEVTVEGDTTQDIALEALALSGEVTWPELKANAAGQGLADSGLHAPSLQQQWTASVPNVMFNSPVTDGETIYLASEGGGGQLTALDQATGEIRWTTTTGSMQRATPALSPDGATLYATTGGTATLVALDTADGSTRWSYDLGTDIPTFAAPTVVDGTVLVAAGSGETGSVHAVDAATGEGAWTTEIGAGIFFGPAVSEGVAVAAATDPGIVVALDVETGEQRWERDGIASLGPAAIQGGTAYLGTSSPDFTTGSVLALDLGTGDTLWEATGHGDTQGSGPVLYDDLVIAGSHTAGTVSAYDAATGELVWSHFEGTAITSTLATTTGGVVLGGSQNWNAFALDASTGELLWSEQQPAPILSSAAVSDDTAIFVSRNGTVAAYQSAGSVQGTVTGPDGPVEATVQLVDTDHTVTSDPDTGDYHLQSPAGEYTLRVTSYGLGSHTEQVRIDPISPLTVDVALEGVGTGDVAGTVTDAAGDPLEGAAASLDGVPLDPATTGPDGTFEIADVAAGDWDLRVELTGYAPHHETVTIEEGGTTTVEVVLGDFEMAVVADYRGQLADVLRAQGWTVDELTWTQAAMAPERYEVLVLNGTSDARASEHLREITVILEGADAAGTSIVALDTWGVASGSVEHVLAQRGSAAVVGSSSANDGTVWLSKEIDHPLTAPIDQPRLPVMERYHAWITGYEGGNLATLGSDGAGERGTGLAYERTSADSVQVLLPSHTASGLVGPERYWTAAGEEIFVTAVGHALEAAFGTVALTVTGPDGPLEATVSVVDSFERQDLPGGTGDLHLDAGEHTLRVTAPGMTTAEEVVTVTAGETTELALTLTGSDAGAIEGTVRDTSGTPVPGATVTAGDAEPVTAGADGSYLVSDLTPGSYLVRAEAEGHTPTEVPDVEVTAGEVTALDLALATAPEVAVLGDHQDRLSTFLGEHQIPATPVGWEVMEDLDPYDVVILQHPASIPGPEFEQHLAAFDEAGVSVIFPAANSAVSTRGVYDLSSATGSPASIERLGGVGSSPKELTDVMEHPITAGLGEEPVIYLNAGTQAPWFEGYDGITLGTVGMDGAPSGPGLAYDVRTPSSVHVLLSGLYATGGNHPDEEWGEAGQQVFLNAVRYAGAPNLAQVTGDVVDPDGVPVPHAEVTVEDRTWSAATDEGGQFRLGLPDGTHHLQVSAHGYEDGTLEVTVVDGAPQHHTVELALGDVGALTGTVTGGVLPGAGNGAPAAGDPLEGATVRVVGTPLQTVTDAQGRYDFPRIEAGPVELEIEVADHLRTLHPFTMSSGSHTEDVTLLESPTVGVVADSTSGATSGRMAAFLEDWGYLPVDVGWTDTAAYADLDMVVVNVGAAGHDPGADGLDTFLDAANRHDLPVIWTGNYSRGGIQYLTKYLDDPTEWDAGTLDGVVTTTVVEDHPLTAGLPETFAPTDAGRMYGLFTGYSGTTVATIASEEGPAGDSIAYDGRTVGSVDVLLSTAGASSYGAPGTREDAAHYFTPETSRVMANALQWAVTAQGLGADTRGAVVDSSGQPVEATVTVEETGRTHPARAGDGSYVVTLDPGTWTLTASAFGYEDGTTTVTVGEGESVTSQITLPTSPGAGITGTVLSPEGAPVEGAEVLVLDTEHELTTGADGTFQVPHLPAGDWTVVARAEGMVTDYADVTVTDGEQAQAELRLGTPAHLVVVADRSTSMTDFLEGNGYTVDRFTYPQVADLDLGDGTYDLIYLNGQGVAPAEDLFTGILDDAAAGDVPVVLPSQFNSGSIRHLSSFTGDPESVNQSFEPEAMGLEVTAEHPVLEGYQVGEVVTTLSNPGSNQQYQAFTGYSGTMLAETAEPATGDTFGGGIGFRFATPGSVHLLLGGLAASSYGAPETRWTDNAERIVLNGVGWAMEARQSEVHGTVTGNGDPVEGAEVTVEGTTARDETGADGAYRVGVAPGEVTLHVTADGYEPFSETVTVGEEESLEHDIALTPLADTSLTVEVVDSVSQAAVPGAAVTLDGPTDGSAETGADGTAVFEPVLVGDYTVTVEGPHHVPATAEVTVGEDPQVLTVEVAPIQVGVLGDTDGDLTAFLIDQDVPSVEVDWADAAGTVDDFGVLVVNGGAPADGAFPALIEAADEARVDLVFTGTYGVTEGGIRLLEEHSEDVVVGGHGYGDGPVGLTDLADHPVLAGLTDPTTIVADEGYYSWLSAYPGQDLATLTVDGGAVGTAVVHEQRTTTSGHLLLSFAAVSDYMGPGRGWTPETETVVLDSLAWLLEDEPVELPEVPTLTTEETLVAASPIEVSGVAPGADEVEVTRDGEVLVAVAPGADGSYTATVELVEGTNVLVARAHNEAGSAESEPLTVVLDSTAPVVQWTPAVGEAVTEDTVVVRGTAQDDGGETVTVTVNGTAVEVSEDGEFSHPMPRRPGTMRVTVTATDALGNAAAETRVVLHRPLTPDWRLPWGDGSNQEVNLTVSDPAGNPVQVAGVELQVLEDGAVVQTVPMEPGRGASYQAWVTGLPQGQYDLRAVLTVAGYEAEVDGPTYWVRR